MYDPDEASAQADARDDSSFGPTFRDGEHVPNPPNDPGSAITAALLNPTPENVAEAARRLTALESTQTATDEVEAEGPTEEPYAGMYDDGESGPVGRRRPLHPGATSPQALQLRDRIDRLYRQPRTGSSRRSQQLREQIDRLYDKWLAVSRYPEQDPCEDGEGLVIARRGDDGQATFTYLALRIDGVYYLTGGDPRTPQRRTWAQLVDWMADRVEPGGLIRLEPGETVA